jgi:hypothetical protein
MRFVSGKLFLATAVLAAAAFAAQTAKAETRVNVPFGFIAAGQAMPAGTYAVQKDSFGNVVTLRNVRTSQSFNWLIGAGGADYDHSKVTLSFDNAGETHALRTIQYGDVITSRLDRNLVRSEHIIASGR